MYTSCQPVYIIVIRIYSNHKLIRNTGPTAIGSKTLQYNFCATKVLLVGSSNFTQFYCTSAAIEYSARINLVRGGPALLQEI
ncbi:hypothetical protein F5X96DRAFT_650200 [Biscogniauxia mediterranea]|nr:hypothetical protein F5X96DRAFT_650200 [Biscogniauxia mediterranea]